ncbi:hypothetical protein Dimus_005792 [Dionaea muscipula]
MVFRCSLNLSPLSIAPSSVLNRRTPSTKGSTEIATTSSRTPTFPHLLFCQRRSAAPRNPRIRHTPILVPSKGDGGRLGSGDFDW